MSRQQKHLRHRHLGVVNEFHQRPVALEQGLIVVNALCYVLVDDDVQDLAFFVGEEVAQGVAVRAEMLVHQKDQIAIQSLVEGGAHFLLHGDVCFRPAFVHDPSLEVVAAQPHHAESETVLFLSNLRGDVYASHGNGRVRRRDFRVVLFGDRIAVDL